MEAAKLRPRARTSNELVYLSIEGVAQAGFRFPRHRVWDRGHQLAYRPDQRIGPPYRRQHWREMRSGLPWATGHESAALEQCYKPGVGSKPIPLGIHAEQHKMHVMGLEGPIEPL
jgi:hypothetical protein